MADPANKGYNIQQRIRKRSQRSSSLGPLLDEHNLSSSLAKQGGNTNSLESIDSNPRQAVKKSDLKHRGSHQGASRRPLPNIPPNEQPGSSPPRHPVEPASGASNGQSGSSSRPPPYHAMSNSGLPPHIPLPGLTCQLSLPPGMSLQPQTSSSQGPINPELHQRNMREQQVS